MSIDHAELDRITDTVLRYRPPNKSLKAAQKIGKSSKKIDINMSNSDPIPVDSER